MKMGQIHLGCHHKVVFRARPYHLAESGKRGNETPGHQEIQFTLSFVNVIMLGLSLGKNRLASIVSECHSNVAIFLIVFYIPQNVAVVLLLSTT